MKGIYCKKTCSIPKPRPNSNGNGGSGGSGGSGGEIIPNKPTRIDFYE